MVPSWLCDLVTAPPAGVWASRETQRQAAIHCRVDSPTPRPRSQPSLSPSLSAHGFLRKEGGGMDSEALHILSRCPGPAPSHSRCCPQLPGPAPSRLVLVPQSPLCPPSIS